jgi:hypothetical protein
MVRTGATLTANRGNGLKWELALPGATPNMSAASIVGLGLFMAVAAI